MPPSPSNIDSSRSIATRRVVKSLADHRFRKALSKIATSDGTHPIVVVMSEDSLQDTLKRIPVEGVANVVVVGEKEMTILTVSNTATLPLDPK